LNTLFEHRFLPLNGVSFQRGLCRVLGRIQELDVTLVDADVIQLFALFILFCYVFSFRIIFSDSGFEICVVVEIQLLFGVVMLPLFLLVLLDRIGLRA